MKTRIFRLLALGFALSLLLPGCIPEAISNPAVNNPTTPQAAAPDAPTVDTPVPTAARTARPTPTFDLPLDLDLTDEAGLPTAPGGAVSAEQRGFQYAAPTGFSLQDAPNRVLMENADKNILISLHLFDHQGQSTAAVFLRAMVRESIYNPIGEPEPYALSGYKGWIANIEAPGIYENGTGQLIVVDVDAMRLFYAVGLAKGEAQWEAAGKQIFQSVLESVTFSGSQP